MLTQDGRLLAIATPLGADVLLLDQVSGRERMSGLFRFEVELLAEPDKAASVKPEALLGENVTIGISYDTGKFRWINGLVSRFGIGSVDSRFAHFTAEIVPWLWLLTLSADCRIFQDKTVPEIVKQVFQDLGYKDFKDSLSGSYTKLDYCVQYRETHFNFVSRLLEREGIFYYFEHENGKHTMVLADAPSVHKPCAIPRAPYQQGPDKVQDRVQRWTVAQEMRSGKHIMRDYNFQLPGNALEVNEPTTLTLSNISKLEVFDYPGAYAHRFVEPDKRLGNVQPEGQTLARLRMEEDEAAHKQLQGGSTCRTFVPGFRFDLGNHPRAEQNGAYVLAALDLEAVQSPTYYSGYGSQSAAPYENTFVCIPHKVRFRPPRATPTPVVQGLQSAIVVGRKGEEIFTDKYGRVKVQFHWDRRGKRDESSSCWVRVAHSVAGKRWGEFTLPRIGQEVLIAFLEGDADEPIIVGGVYNAEQMPPYELPDEMTKSMIKTNSSKGGDGFNELRFEDRSGKEQIFIHAERNLDLRIKNDRMELVGNDMHLIVDKDQKEQVKGNKHLHVEKDHVEKIDQNMQLTVGSDQDIAIKGGKKETIGAANDLHVKGDRKQKVDGTLSVQAGMNYQEKAGMNYAMDAGMAVHIKGGMTVVIEGGLQCTLKGPGGFIDINPAGVTIQGTLVMINSGGAAGVGSGSQPQSPQDAKEASPKDPTKADDAKTGAKSSSD
jgi:type VI secretion system secreted protein VgrG